MMRRIVYRAPERDSFTEAKEVLDIMLKHYAGTRPAWDLMPGPAVHPDEIYYSDYGPFLKCRSKGGIQFDAKGPAYQGRVLLCRMEDGTYAILAGGKIRDGIPEKLVGDAVDRFMLGPPR